MFTLFTLHFLSPDFKFCAFQTPTYSEPPGDVWTPANTCISFYDHCCSFCTWDTMDMISGHLLLPMTHSLCYSHHHMWKKPPGQPTSSMRKGRSPVFFNKFYVTVWPWKMNWYYMPRGLATNLSFNTPNTQSAIVLVPITFSQWSWFKETLAEGLTEAVRNARLRFTKQSPHDVIFMIQW